MAAAGLWLQQEFVPVYRGADMGPLFLPADPAPTKADLAALLRGWWAVSPWLVHTFPGRTLYALRQVRV
jgi:hypothetical protein